MRSLQKVLGIILLSIFTFSACNENISDPQSSVSNDNKSLAKQVDIQKYQRIAKVMAANNLGQGAYFIEPTDAGYRLIQARLPEGEYDVLFDGRGSIMVVVIGPGWVLILMCMFYHHHCWIPRVRITALDFLCFNVIFKCIILTFKRFVLCLIL